MIVTIARSSEESYAEVDHNFKIQATPLVGREGELKVKGSQLLLAGFKRHPYGASLEKDSIYWLSKRDVVFCDNNGE